ncbi:MAG: MFS transporter, partial [Anaerolineae bacterium]|nr:MFS transporter [Anaerolineae bacterium]
GPLADRVFEPAMMPGGALVDVFGGFSGVGPGAGMGVMFVIFGAFGVAVGLGGYLFPAVRDAETLLPDHGGG